MNQMNINEHVFASCDSLCFVARKMAFIARKCAFWAVGCKTNVVAAPKKWFIEVHLVHRKAILEQLFHILMNLMNFDVLTGCFRLSFDMEEKAGFGLEANGRNAKFIKVHQVHWKGYSMKRSKSEIELAPIMAVLAAGLLFLLELFILAAVIAEKFGG